MINGQEAKDDVRVTGTVGGDAQAGDTVTLTVGDNTYEGEVTADADGNLTYAIDVPGSVLAENDTVYAEVTGTDSAGNDYSAETDRDYSVNLDASAKITIDKITGDDVINGEEAKGDVCVTGTVGGDAQAGDTVTLTVGDNSYIGIVGEDQTYAIDVPGSVLAENDTVYAEVTGTDSAGNPYSAETGRDYSVDIAPSSEGGYALGDEDSSSAGHDDFLLKWEDFNITDKGWIESDPGIVVTELPTSGWLQAKEGDGWRDVEEGERFSKAQIDADELRFKPEANESGFDGYGGDGVGNMQADYAKFSFKPAGELKDGKESTFTIDITPVADKPNVELEVAAGDIVPGAGAGKTLQVNGGSSQRGGFDVRDGQIVKIGDNVRVWLSEGDIAPESTGTGVVAYYDQHGNPAGDADYCDIFVVRPDSKLLHNVTGVRSGEPDALADYIFMSGPASGYAVSVGTNNRNGQINTLENVHVSHNGHSIIEAGNQVEGFIYGDGTWEAQDKCNPEPPMESVEGEKPLQELVVKVSAQLTDTDGSEVLSGITLKGIPEGASVELKDAPMGIGLVEQDGVWTITNPEHLSGLKDIQLSLKVPAGSEPFEIVAVASSTEVYRDADGNPVALEGVTPAYGLATEYVDVTSDNIIVPEVSLAVETVHGLETVTKDGFADLGVGGSGDGWINDPRPPADTEKAYFDFGKAHAGETFTLSWTQMAKGGWEDGRTGWHHRGGTRDTFKVFVNGQEQYETSWYDPNNSNWTRFKPEHQSLTVTLDKNGQAVVEFEVRSTEANEVVDVSNIKAELNVETTIYKVDLSGSIAEGEIDYYEVEVDGGQLLYNGNVLASENGVYRVEPSQLGSLTVRPDVGLDTFDVRATSFSDKGVSSDQALVNVDVEMPSTPPEVSIDLIETGQEAGVDVLTKVWGSLKDGSFGTTGMSVNTHDASQMVSGSSLKADCSRNLKIVSKTGSNETAYLQVGDTYSIKWQELTGYKTLYSLKHLLGYKQAVWEDHAMEGTVTRSDKTDVNGSGNDVVVFSGKVNGVAKTLVIDNGPEGVREGTYHVQNHYYTNDKDDSTVGFREMKIAGSADADAEVTVTDKHGQVVDTVKANANGEWTTALKRIDGDSGELKATAVDKDGNISVDIKHYQLGDTGNNVLHGTEANDLLYGGAGNDTLVGGDGDDTLIGGKGNDTLYGGAGDDTLIGGPGDDILVGGLGADTFKWEFGDQGSSHNAATDVVKDFTQGVFGKDAQADRLDLSDLLKGENNESIDQYIRAEQQGSDTVLHIKSEGGLSADNSNADQRVVLKDVTMPQGENSSDFIQSMLQDHQLKIDH
ncbi:Ig-like domain-containing protein [Vreelandella sp. TE19]